MDGLAGALQGQPGYVVIAVVLIAATAYVVVRVWRKEADDGGGQAGLAAVDSAAEFLTEKALEERGLRHDAEKERDAAQTTRDEALAELSNVRAELVSRLDDLRRCEQEAEQVAQRAVEDERRRSGPA